MALGALRGGARYLGAWRPFSVEGRRVALAPDGMRGAVADERAIHFVDVLDGAVDREHAEIAAPRVTSLLWLGPTTLVWGSEDGSLRIVDILGGAPREVAAHPRGVTCLAATAGGELVSGGRDGSVKRWSRSLGLVREQKPHSREVTALAVRGDEILSASQDGSIAQWNLARGTVTPYIFGRPIIAICPRPDGRLLVLDHVEGHVALCKLDPVEHTAERISGLNLPTLGVLMRPLSLSFPGVPGRDHVLAARGNGVVHYWDGTSLHPLFAARGTIVDASLSADSRHILIAREDGVVQAWNLENGLPLGLGPIRTLSSNERCCLASDGRVFQVRDLATGESAAYRGIAAALHGKVVTSLDASGLVERAELAGVKLRDIAVVGRHEGARVLAATDRSAATATPDGKILAWLPDGSTRSRDVGHPVSRLAWSDDGTRLLVTRAAENLEELTPPGSPVAGSMGLWTVATDEYREKTGACAGAFLGEQPVLAVKGEGWNWSIGPWNPATDAFEPRWHNPTPGALKALSVSPDRAHLLEVTPLWVVRRTVTPRKLEGFDFRSETPTTGGFSADGKLILIATRTGSIHRYRLRD